MSKFPSMNDHDHDVWGGHDSLVEQQRCISTDHTSVRTSASQHDDKAANAVFVPGFNPPPSLFAPVMVQVPPSRRRQGKKSKTHRKKHVPSGPAGVWFQTQQQQQHGDRKQVQDANGDYDDDEALCTQADNKSNKRQQQSKHNSTSFYNPAWTAMQCALGFVTPNCPPWLSTAQRYALVRPRVPDRFVLIREIGGNAMQSIWKLPNDRKMLVLVHTIHAAMGDHHLWTVGLTDETGSFIQAWIQPSFVQKEQQRPIPQYLRLGVVWMISNVTLMLVANASETSTGSIIQPEEDDEDEENEADDDDTFYHQGCHQVKRLERVILISDSSIEQIWTPAMEKDISNEQYIQWMEQRQAATLLLETSPAVQNQQSSVNATTHKDTRSHHDFEAQNMKDMDMDIASCSSSSSEEREFLGSTEINEEDALLVPEEIEKSPNLSTARLLERFDETQQIQIPRSQQKSKQRILSPQAPFACDATIPPPANVPLLHEMESFVSVEKENVNSEKSTLSMGKTERRQISASSQRKKVSPCSKASSLWTCKATALTDIFDEDDDEDHSNRLEDDLTESPSKDRCGMKSPSTNDWGVRSKDSTTKSAVSHREDTTGDECTGDIENKNSKSKPQESFSWNLGGVNMEDFLSDDDYGEGLRILLPFF